MRVGLPRRLALFVGGILERIYPKTQSAWARAMCSEIEQVADDRAALMFALGCLWGGCRQAAAEQLLAADNEDVPMNGETKMLRRPRNVGILCALAATGLGIAYLVSAGAPARYIVVNAVAFLLGLVALRGFAAAGVHSDRAAGVASLAFAAALLATALFGASADGASRWIWIGPLGVQVSLVVVPPMILAFARQPGAIGGVAIATAAAALAIQPDRAMAGVLALGMAVLAALRPGRWPVAAFLVAALAFAVTLARPDALQAAPFVDQILYTAFDVHMLAGAAVLAGSLLLLVPSLVGWCADPARGHVYGAFGAVWLGAVLAAAMGNYPTPVVGYGGSAILGYLLSVSFFPQRLRSGAAGPAGGVEEEDPQQAAGLPRRALPA